MPRFRVIREPGAPGRPRQAPLDTDVRKSPASSQREANGSCLLPPPKLHPLGRRTAGRPEHRSRGPGGVACVLSAAAGPSHLWLPWPGAWVLLQSQGQLCYPASLLMAQARGRCQCWRPEQHTNGQTLKVQKVSALFHVFRCLGLCDTCPMTCCRSTGSAHDVVTAGLFLWRPKKTVPAFFPAVKLWT